MFVIIFLLFSKLFSQNILVLNIINISSYNYKSDFEKITEFESFSDNLPHFSFENLLISSNSFTESDITEIEEEDYDELRDLYSLVEPEPINLGGDGLITIIRRETGETITVRYRNKDGSYNDEALESINYIARCSLTQEIKKVPIKLIELIDRVSDRFGKKTVILLSGYRTKPLNDITPGAAKKSLHLIGWAMDIKINGVSAKKIKDFAKSLKVGGVGYYPKYGYVHLDVGKVRYWERYQYSKKTKYAKKGKSKKVLYSQNLKYSGHNQKKR